MQIFLFGSFELKTKDRAIHLPTRKMEALLAYLALHRSVQNREKIASLFWGDSPDELARRSLRTALSVLRKELGDGFIITDRETVQLNPQVPLWVDVYEVEKQAENILAAGSQAGIDLDLYRGELLHNFYDEWILEEREHYRKLIIDALLQLAQLLRTGGEYARAISAAQKIISIDPINERAYQHLIFCQGALGKRLEALKSYEEFKQRLMEQFGIEPSKDTSTLYEQLKNSDTDGTHAATVKSNLPIPLTSFVGREKELSSLSGIFDTTRLLTLTGVGGCGKTRLAIQLASQLADAFPDGVWWIELAAIQDESSLTPVVMKTLGIAESQSDSAEEVLLKFLRTRQTLLVMDNCEHVISACARLAENILSQCPDVKILATSREALSIHGEVAWLVPSLSLPPADQTNNLMKWECPRLFFERAIMYRADLQLNESNSESLLRICRALEGIPLAVELAAARVKTLSLEQLASRLDDKLSLLTTGSRAAQPRQQTLRATIDWSYELLSEQEKVVLHRLSLFFGTWTLEAAEFVCSEDNIASNQILDVITRLLDKSLLISENHDGLIRYRMLEIIRQYGMEKLEQMDEVQHIQDRHTRYYSELAQSEESAWYSQEQARLIKQFDIEYPNLRVALAWGLENPQRAENWENGLNLAIALVPFWNFRAELHESHYWLKKVVDQIDVVLAESDLGSQKRNELLSIKASAIYEMGALSYYLTHHATRIDLFEEAATIYGEIGDQRGLARPNLYVAQTAADRGQTDLARKIWWESLEQFEQSGDSWYAAMVYSFLGALERRLGNYDESERKFHQAIALYEKVGDQWGRTIMFMHLGMIAMYRGDPVTARGWFQQRLRIGSEIGFKFSQAYAVFLIGLTYWKSGDTVEMGRCLLQAIPRLQQIGSYATLADCIIGIAWISAESGDLEKAAYLLGAVERINETFGRKVYFEYDYFNKPLCQDLRSRLGQDYQDTIERGKTADMDEIVRDLLKI